MSDYMTRQIKQAEVVAKALEGQKRIRCNHLSYWGMDDLFKVRAVSDFEFDLSSVASDQIVSTIIEQAVLYGIQVGREEKRREFLKVIGKDDE